jgi:hypothetical protein
MSATTRRNFIAGAAVGVASVAVTTALAAAPAAVAAPIVPEPITPLPARKAKPDPIFALIEKHRRLQAEAMALSDARTELEESLPHDVTRRPRVATTPERDGKATLVERTEEYEVIRHEWTGLTGNCYWCDSLADLPRHAKSIPEEHRDVWIADREAAFKRDRRALRRRQRKAGLTQIVKRGSAAIDAEYLAGQELISTAPTTLAGVAALARYCIECHETMADVWPDGEDAYTLLASIAGGAWKRSAPDGWRPGAWHDQTGASVLARIGPTAQGDASGA